MFDFELSNEKIRKTNILIDYKIRKKLNFKSVPRMREENNPATKKTEEIQNCKKIDECSTPSPSKGKFKI